MSSKGKKSGKTNGGGKLIPHQDAINYDIQAQMVALYNRYNSEIYKIRKNVRERFGRDESPRPFTRTNAFTPTEEAAMRSQDEAAFEEFRTKIENLVRENNIEPQKALDILIQTEKENIERVNEQQGGASKKHIYKGKSYTVRIGSKGGKYILVGKDKKKIYI